MAKPRALPIIVDDTGAPYTAAAPTVLACVVASTGAARWPTPRWPTRAAGKYSVQPSNDDEATGLTMLFDAGAGRWPRYFTLAIHLEDNSNQHMAFHLEAEDGTLWTGAAASISATDAGGGARTARLSSPLLTRRTAPACSRCCPRRQTPTPAPFVRIAAPPAPPSVLGATEERLTTPGHAPARPMRNPASDVAELLNGKDAGGSRSRSQPTCSRASCAEPMPPPARRFSLPTPAARRLSRTCQAPGRARCGPLFR